MSNRLQLGIYGHAVTDDAGSAYHWSIFDLNAASDYIIASGCGRDRRDPVTGAWVAVGKAAAWLKDQARTPRSVTIVARREVAKDAPSFPVHQAMRERIIEYIEGLGATIVWDSAGPSEIRAMSAECQADLAEMRRVEQLARARAVERGN